MGTLSFFPVPYPDECYYSVLCRYMVHSGLPSARETLITLFGGYVSPGAALLMPYLSKQISAWLNQETGITEDRFIRDHTAFHYLRLSYRKKEGDAMLRRARNGEKSWYRLGYRNSMASSGLCYCPVCAYEEKTTYGEMYWHREHQLKGNRYCIRHGERLVYSGIDLKKMKRSLVPASYALKDACNSTLDGIMADRDRLPIAVLEKHKAVQQDITWLMKHGDQVNGIEEVTSRYAREIRNKGLQGGTYGTIRNAPELKRGMEEYFGSDFLEGLHLWEYEFMEWNEAPVIIVKFFSPLEHVLMMEYLCGSVKKFFREPIEA